LPAGGSRSDRRWEDLHAQFASPNPNVFDDRTHERERRVLVFTQRPYLGAFNDLLRSRNIQGVVAK